MNEFDALFVQAKELMDDFSSLELVKKYQLAKATLENDSHLSQIKKQERELQKGISLLPYEKRKEAIHACKVLNEEYDNDPLVINYRFLKEEILSLIEPLTETKL